jgi:DNA mismatch repair ATPase MutS
MEHGVCPKSYGMNVARMAGISETVGTIFLSGADIP